MVDIVRYVDTASSGGNGTTQAHSGANAAYASLSAWEAAEQQNLTDSGGDTMTVFCAGSANTDTTQMEINGWTTGSTNTITVAGDPTAPDGDGLNTGNTYSSSFYHRTTNATSNRFGIVEDYVIIDGIQFEVIGANINNGATLNFYGGTGSNNLGIVRNCRFRNSGTGTGDTITFLLVEDANNVVQITNCTFEHRLLFQDWCVRVTASAGTTIFNCTMYQAGLSADGGGVQRTGGTVSVTNCAVFNMEDDFSGTITLLNCAQDDNDAHTGRVALNSNASGEWTAAFTDRTTGDFRVASTSALIYNAGTNTGAPNRDIIGTSRPQAVTTDIGAWELISAATGGYFRRGSTGFQGGFKEMTGGFDA